MIDSLAHTTSVNDKKEPASDNMEWRTGTQVCPLTSTFLHALTHKYTDFLRVLVALLQWSLI